jgi:hypothetical protein
MKKNLKIVFINFMVFSSFIVGLEILAQLAYLIKNGELVFMATPYHSEIFEMHPYLAARPKASIKVTQNEKTITTTHNHTRWTGAQADDQNLIRIAILGGSTAFGTGVTDEDSWPAILQAKLGEDYAVINYGVPGYSTTENIIQMALIVPEKRPHVVIFYEGWNDIRNYHEKELGSDYYGHGMRQYESLRVPVFEHQNRFQSLRSTFATAWLIDRIHVKAMVLAKQDYELFKTPDESVDRLYIRNLNTLKLLSQNIDALTIFVPQILNYTHYNETAGSDSWARHISNDAMYTLMSQFNSHMGGICSQEEQNCIVLAEVLEEQWVPDNFVDQGHLSRSGGLKLAEVVHRFIRNEFDRSNYDETTQQSTIQNRDS